MKIKHLNRLTSKITVCLLLLFTACQENIIYHSYQPIHSEGWYRNDTLTYTFKSPMVYENLHEWQIGIRHLDSYPYQDLWIGIIPFTKDSLTQYKTDSIHLYLADSNGNWEGTGIGELRQFTQKNLFQPVQGKNDTIIGFKIIHLMQDNPLPKIYDIGLRIHGILTGHTGSIQSEKNK